VRERVGEKKKKKTGGKRGKEEGEGRASSSLYFLFLPRKEGRKRDSRGKRGGEKEKSRPYL